MRMCIPRRNFSIFLVVVGLGWSAFSITAQTNDLLSPKLQSKDAPGAWNELMTADAGVATPPEWKIQPPTAQEKQQFLRPYLLALIDKTKDFYTRFPNDTNALAAKLQEFQLLDEGARWANIGTNLEPARAAMEKSLLDEPTLPENQRFQIRASAVDREAQIKAEKGGRPAFLEEYIKGVVLLQKEFPTNIEMVKLVYQLTRAVRGAQGKPLWQILTNNSLPPDLRDLASNSLVQINYIGKPIALQFTAVDGREVDLAKMKGKVVLLDFWATWCPPCVGEVPEVVSNYDRYHSQGFEIVGISLDDDKSALLSFVAQHQMPWPQYYDGLHWQSKYAQQFKVQGVPSMWLIDKKGIVRDLNIEPGFGDTVEKMLAE
jgi:peroxiredoxin